MTFVASIFQRLQETGSKALVTEMHGSERVPATGADMVRLTSQARAALRGRGVRPGDRVVLLAPNSARWIAADLALLAEGATVVPLYVRQSPTELVQMMRDDRVWAEGRGS